MNYLVKPQLSRTERTALSGYSDIVAHLLFHRGFTDELSALSFMEPDYDTGIHDPFLLKDAEKAADRIIQAIEKDEKIAIYADYDADGIPGAAIWNDFFRRIGYANFVLYIPHRHDEGFGVHIDAVTDLADRGVKLMITVDCGITDVLPIAHATKQGIEVIITDHHEPPPVLPQAFAIIDHKQADCFYPDKNLCGSGVAYKLIQAVLKKNRFGLKEGHEKWLLDLVGIATLSDMVPLVGENRVLAHYGLAVLRKSPRKGITRLLSMLKIAQRHVTEDDIAFMITPRINAASRMGLPMDAFKLLAADTDEDASAAAKHLDGINTQRKTVVATLVKEVKKKVRERYAENLPLVIVLGNPDWKPSLLGLAANSCAEEFDRPVFLWGRDGDNVIKGSCRSEGRSNVVEIMRGVPAGGLKQFGGHMFSGGFAVENDEIHFLEKRLNESAELIRKNQEQEMEKQGEDQKEDVWVSGKHKIDMELNLDMITSSLHEDINKLAPFGVANPKPVFLFRNIVPAAIKRFGKTQDHIEISFVAGFGRTIPAIAFFAGTEEWVSKVIPNKAVDLVASLEKSMFRGRPELRLRVIEVIAS